MMGCILRDFDYEPPPNVPPSVESRPNGSTPLNRIIKVDLSATPGGDAGIPNEIHFEAEVRDQNVDQQLLARIYFDNTLLRELPIPAILDSADPGRRPVEFDVPRSGIARGCHLVELLVTSEGGFEPFPSREPREPGDIGSAQWWIAAGLTPDDPVEMNDCPEGQ